MTISKKVTTGIQVVNENDINEFDSLLSFSVVKNLVTVLGKVSHDCKVVFKNSSYLSMLVFVAASFLMGCHDHDDHDHNEPWQAEVDQVRSSVSAYSNFDNAKNDGYDTDITGYRTQMGFHYLKASILDEEIDLKNPELVLYVPGDNGKLKFVAVEYAVPIADMNNPPPAPEGFKGTADVWEINTEFKVWTLHVWVALDNPHGIFSPHNPNLP